MINSTDLHDLQLEDVEDYASDYPTNYPQSEQNIAAVGSFDDTTSKKRRTTRVVYLMRKNKWATALLFVIVVIALALFVIAGGSKEDKVVPSNSSGGVHQKPLYIDPKSLDPAVTESLMAKLVSVYSRKGLDSSALEEDNGATPQKKAFYWLASFKDVNDMDHTMLMQRYSLAVFYYATNAVQTPYSDKPKPWISAHLWLSASHVCEWKGIVCNEQDHVSAINLERNNLTGSLPQELAIIASTLHTIDLTSNLIYMEQDMYDVFHSLTQLHTLLMDDNYLMYEKGLPSQFKSLERLQKLRLSYNLLSGELERDHKVLPSLTKLTHLELESNFLSGTLPPVIGELTNLVYLYMRRNELSFNLDFLKSGNLKDLCKWTEEVKCCSLQYFFFAMQWSHLFMFVWGLDP